MEVEDKIKFTNISKILIKNLYKAMNEFQDDKLILILIYDSDEIQGSISFINNFELLVFDEVAHFRFTGDYQLIDLNIKTINYFFKELLFLLL